MEESQSLSLKADRNRRSFMFSLLVHVAALLLVRTGEPGLPTGRPNGRLYALTYLGEVTGEARAPAGEPRPARVAPASAPRRPTVRQEAPRVAVSKHLAVKAQPAPRPTSPAAQVVTSPKGDTKLPVPDAKKELPTESAATTPAKVEQRAEEPQPTRPAEVQGEGQGAGTAPQAAGAGGEGLPAPPRGSGMVAALPRLVYPKAAQNAGVRGTVGLRVTVGGDGRPIKAEVERSSGDGSLDAYAQRSVERGLVTRPWVSSYALRVEVHFSGGVPEISVLDEPVQVVGG